MARFRRLCVDVQDGGRVVGASVEFFSGERRDHEAVWVDGRTDYTGATVSSVVDELHDLGWLQPRLPFSDGPYEDF